MHFTLCVLLQNQSCCLMWILTLSLHHFLRHDIGLEMKTKSNFVPIMSPPVILTKLLSALSAALESISKSMIHPSLLRIIPNYMVYSGTLTSTLTLCQQSG